MTAPTLSQSIDATRVKTLQAAIDAAIYDLGDLWNRNVGGEGETFDAIASALRTALEATRDPLFDHFPICDHCDQPRRLVDGDGYCDDCWYEVYGISRREKYQPILGTPVTCETCRDHMEESRWEESRWDA